MTNFFVSYQQPGPELQFSFLFFTVVLYICVVVCIVARKNPKHGVELINPLV